MHRMYMLAWGETPHCTAVSTGWQAARHTLHCISQLNAGRPCTQLTHRSTVSSGKPCEPHRLACRAASASSCASSYPGVAAAREGATLPNCAGSAASSSAMLRMPAPGRVGPDSRCSDNVGGGCTKSWRVQPGRRRGSAAAARPSGKGPHKRRPPGRSIAGSSAPRTWPRWQLQAELWSASRCWALWALARQAGSPDQSKTTIRSGNFDLGEHSGVCKAGDLTPRWVLCQTRRRHNHFASPPPGRDLA